MSTASLPTSPALDEELHSGDRMSREDFHRIYCGTPEGFKAELIGGVVYVASPLKRPHGTSHPYLSAVLTAYQGNTPGLEIGDNTTIILDEDEPQPDLYLRILPEYGGQSRTTDDEYVAGAPELVAEVAHSSRAIDLHDKRARYTRFGVREYIVLCLREREVRWFDLTSGRELIADQKGVFRSEIFPGLWIDTGALLARLYGPLLDMLHQGLKTTEYATFARELAQRRP